MMPNISALFVMLQQVNKYVILARNNNVGERVVVIYNRAMI